MPKCRSRSKSQCWEGGWSTSTSSMDGWGLDRGWTSGLDLVFSRVSVMKWEVAQALAQHQMIGGVSFTLPDIAGLEWSHTTGQCPSRYKRTRNRSHPEESLLWDVDSEKNLSFPNKSQTQRTECYSWQLAPVFYERQIIRQEQTSSIGISGRDHCGGLLIKCLGFILSLHIIASWSWFDPANYVNHQSLEKALGSWSPQEQCKPHQPATLMRAKLRREQQPGKTTALITWNDLFVGDH